MFGAGIAGNIAGLEVVKMLTGGRSHRWSAASLTVSLQICGRKTYGAEEAMCPACMRRQQALMAAGRTWSARRVGLVTDLSPQMRGAEEPVPPFLYTATLAHFDFRTVDRQERLSRQGRTERGAILSALGEAVERYSAYHWDPARTFSQTGRRLVTPPSRRPTAFSTPKIEQYPEPAFIYSALAGDVETSWISGVELPHGTRSRASCLPRLSGAPVPAH